MEPNPNKVAVHFKEGVPILIVQMIKLLVQLSLLDQNQNPPAYVTKLLLFMYNSVMN